MASFICLLEIIEVIKKSSSYSVFQERYEDILRALGCEVKRACSIHDTSTFDTKLYHYLLSWIAKRSDKATLGELCSALCLYDCNEIADNLSKVFENPGSVVRVVKKHAKFHDYSQAGSCQIVKQINQNKWLRPATTFVVLICAILIVLGIFKAVNYFVTQNGSRPNTDEYLSNHIQKLHGIRSQATRSI